MDMSVSYYCATGRRENNEDCVSVRESASGLLALVADGLGGHAKGEVASHLAVSTLNRLLLHREPEENALTDAIEEASRQVHLAQETGNNMKTTIAALWVAHRRAFAAHVGDSRIYHIRNGRILYQSVDHSVSQMAVMVGEITLDQIRTHRDRNKLIRVLGNANAPKVDCEELELQAGDRLLICSDGFWEPVDENYMCASSLRFDSAKDWLEDMKQAVLQANKPNQDNHTAIALVIHQV